MFSIRKSNGSQNSILFLVKLYFSLAFLPLYLLIYLIRPLWIFRTLRQSGIKGLFRLIHVKRFIAKTVACLFIFIVLLPTWVIGYLTLGIFAADQLGYIPDDIVIVGTGSMYPTWEKGTKGKSSKELSKEVISTAGFFPYPNGIAIGEKRFFSHTLGRGDIITWENDATRKVTSEDGSEPAGLLKRVIGLPGDKIELRDGVVHLNGEPQKEPYIAKPHSTFGEKFLRECKVITVPEDSVFAMGDNRKGSADSREIGFAPIKDIYYVLPLDKQKGTLDKNWHDATNDITNSTKPKINKDKFVKLLNEIRKEKGLGPLKYQAKLEKSAFLRGEAILKDNDFEQKGSYTMEKSMKDAGYWNTLWWEVPIQGYYEADELIEDYLERDWTDAKETWFDKDFDDIGIAEVEGVLNGCPTQVITIHVAGYVPPNYEKEDIEAWKSTLLDLKDIQPGWAGLKDNSDFYQKNKEDIDRINDLISLRIANINSIVNRMEANQWLTPEEERMIDQDEALFEEIDTIATRLNSL